MATTANVTITSTPGAAVDSASCGNTHKWYVFLGSSAITFTAGLLLVISWRLGSYFCCSKKASSETAKKPGTPQKGPKALTKSPDPEIGWMTEAKDWAGELISGQTTTGRILVSLYISYDHPFCRCWKAPDLLFIIISMEGNSTARPAVQGIKVCISEAASW